MSVRGRSNASRALWPRFRQCRRARSWDCGRESQDLQRRKRVFMAMTQTIEERTPVQLSVSEAQAIVAEAAHGYFDSRRARVDGFVDRRFSLLGSLALHREALGWDLLKAPANIALAVPYIGAQLTARIA